jgi:hypothetical protein
MGLFTRQIEVQLIFHASRGDFFDFTESFVHPAFFGRAGKPRLCVRQGWPLRGHSLILLSNQDDVMV